MSDPTYLFDASNGETEITSWDALMAALQTQIAAGAGLAGGRVIWGDQSGDRPDNDFIEIRFDDSDGDAPATPEEVVEDNIVTVAGATTVPGWDGNPNHYKLTDVSNLPMIPTPAPVLHDPSGVIDSSRYTVDLNAGTFDFAGHTPPTGAVTVDYSAIPNHGEIAIVTVEHSTFKFDVHFFSSVGAGKGSAWARLQAVRQYLQRDDVVSALDAADVALVEISTIKNLSAVLETQIESRAFFTVTVRAAIGSKQVTTYIETVNADWAPGQPKGSALNP